jgi:hydrogenase-4 component B
MIDMGFFILSLFIVFGLGFLLPIVWRNQQVSTISLWLALIASVFGGVVSGAIWLNFLPLPKEFVIPLNLWKGLAQGFEDVLVPALQVKFQLDHLSAFFVFLVTAFSAIVAVYSFGALDAPHYQRYRLRIVSAFNLFVWATVMVVIAYDIFSLILTLEIMTLAFGYLVLYKHTLFQDEENPRVVSEEKLRNARLAPQVYMVISHTSTAFLLIAALILAIWAHNISFDGIYRNGFCRNDRNAQNALCEVIQDDPLQKPLPAGLSTVVFLLALAGLGIRAGLTPAHIWVSLVHPSSPTTTHALSLGIAIKVAIYLMYRFFFQFLQPQEWWGYLILLVAVFTALVNVWYAISSHDLKSALAYHSIENIGIISVGIGLGMIFWERNPLISTLALIASLYHLLNHAVFKGLLYLATGAIDNLTHQIVEFDQLGGLIHRYRFTSTMFLIGSFSIAGFPPFNGFISEWLTLQALFKGLIEQRVIPFVGLGVTLLSLMLLIASFALTAFCFYKMAGVTLLGLPRLPESEREYWEQRDVSRTMKSMMLLMAFLCLFLGLMPRLIVSLLGYALQPIGIQVTVLNLSGDWARLSFGAETMSGSLPVFAMLGLTLALLLIPFLINLRRTVVRPSKGWNCGEPSREPPLHQYTSSGASFLLRDLFGLTTLSKMLRTVPNYLPAHFSLSHSARYPQEMLEFFSVGYNLVIYKLLEFSEKFGRWLQNRDIRRYLWYIFLVNLVILLVFILTNIFGGI